MSALYDKGKKLHVEVYAGVSIYDASKEAKQLSKDIDMEVAFGFNGVYITTDGYSVDQMVKEYYRKLK